MNDEQLVRELRAALLRDDPGPVRDELRARIAGVPDEVRRRKGLGGSIAVSRSLATVAALAVVGVAIAVALALRGSSGSSQPTNPPASSLPSIRPSPSTSTTVNGPWRGLSWSAQHTFPGAQMISDVVAFKGSLVAAGATTTPGGTSEVAIWRSADGTSWTPLVEGGATFAGARIDSLIPTDAGLVAWGYVGEPACTGQGAGTTCGPTPLMIWTSADGASWDRVADMSLFANATIAAMTAGSHGLVAVGRTPRGAAIWVSSSGASWQQLTLPAVVFADAQFSDVRAIASGYVAAGSAPPAVTVGFPRSSAAAWWSTDGRSWTMATVNRTDGLGTSLGKIQVGSAGLVAVGSASGGNEGTAWTSTDGRFWTPIAPGYAGAPAPSAGIPTLPSFTVIDDGTHLIAIGVGNQLALLFWASADGSTWQALPPSGVVGTIPLWSGMTTQPTIVRAFVVAGGLIVIGQPLGTTSAEIPYWRVTAVP